MKEESGNDTKRTTISITPSILAKAQRIMKARDFKDFAGFLHQLIREEWERRHGTTRICGKCERTYYEKVTAPQSKAHSRRARVKSKERPSLGPADEN